MSHSSIAIAQELIRDIESRIDAADLSPDRVNAGIVSYLGDGIAKVVGLRNVAYNEVVTFQSGAKGVAMNLEEHYVGIVILSGFSTIAEGMTAQGSGKILEVPVGEALLGRVVDSLGNPIDGKGEIKAKEYYPAERVATGVMSRKSVHEPLATGIKAVDALVPIGRGQRELIIGDRQTGKTQIAIRYPQSKRKWGEVYLCGYRTKGLKGRSNC